MKSIESGSDTIKTFLKFGSETNIQDLHENGTIFMNPIQYFRSFEDAELRGDKYEGISKIKNYPPGTFEIPALNFKGNYINIHLKTAFKEVLGNIYSLYCISSFTIPKPFEFSIDERVAGFGTHCLMIKNNIAFLSRIEKTLQKQNLKYRHGFVTYYDRYKINGEVTLFQKPHEFCYQNEFRFYAETNNTNPLKINIGSLKDIAQIAPTSEIITLRLVPRKQVSL
jgi:hypothetical protein